MKKILGALLALALFLIGGADVHAAASNGAGRLRLQAGLVAHAWPDLATGGFAFTCGRFTGNEGLSAATTSLNTFGIVNLYCPTPPYGGNNLWVHLPNWYTAGSTAPERAGTSIVSIDGLTVCLDTTCSGGVFYRCTFTGANSFSQDIVPLAGAMAHCFKSDGWPHNSAVYIRLAYHVPQNGHYPIGMFPVLAGQDLGEGRVNAATAQTALLNTGAIAQTSTNTAFYGPDFAVVDGYDGTTPVALGAGDSRPWGVNDIYTTLANRGFPGATGRALDDLTSGRWGYGNLSGPGRWLQFTAQSTGFAFQLEMAALRQVPNRPYNVVFTNLYGNDINGTTNTSLATLQSSSVAWWNYHHINCPSCLIFHTFGEPWGLTPLNNTFFSTVADQVPAANACSSCIQGQYYQWLKSTGPPAYVHPVDLSAAYQAPNAPDRWVLPNPIITGTASGVCTVGLRTCNFNLSSLPNRGDSLVLEPTTSNGETIQVATATGASNPRTLVFISSIAKTHPDLSAVTTATTRDGVHPDSILNLIAAAIMEALKTMGVIHGP